METKLIDFLRASLTPYHAVRAAAEYLEAHGFARLEEGAVRRPEPGRGYYTVRNGSALAAFRVGREASSFSVVASHTDSPALKVKLNPESRCENCTRLNVEVYGGMLQGTWFDRPLRLAGRAVVRENGKLRSVLAEGGAALVIPSVAIHFNREANKGVSIDAQRDLQPLAGLDAEAYIENAIRGCLPKGAEFVEGDLFIVNAQEPFRSGLEGELLSAPRLDNLTSVFASLEALVRAEPAGIAVAALFDNEETGSRSRQGAGGRFLRDTLLAVGEGLGLDAAGMRRALCGSLLVSCDNAHAVHPNRPELSDPTNRVRMGGGIVVKHHANGNYTTDALTGAAFKEILRREGIPFQDFFMRSDLPCGGTLGAVSSAQLSVPSVDIGLAQLAMHSSVETMAAADYDTLVSGLAAFYRSRLEIGEGEISVG